MKRNRVEYSLPQQMRVRAVDYVLLYNGMGQMSPWGVYDPIDGLSIMVRILGRRFSVGTAGKRLFAAWDYFDIPAPGIH